jgi:hypothetical protein
MDGAKRENAKLKKELAAAKKLNSQAEKEHKGREVRLARALEECDKFKAVLKEATQETKATGGDFRKEKVRVVRGAKKRGLARGAKRRSAASSTATRFARRHLHRSNVTVAFSSQEKLQQQVRSLERQRGELLTAFKKQMKLIDVLKRQKVHVEAAKLLEFTEEEFVKVLEWGN